MEVFGTHWNVLFIQYKIINKKGPILLFLEKPGRSTGIVFFTWPQACQIQDLKSWLFGVYTKCTLDCPRLCTESSFANCFDRFFIYPCSIFPGHDQLLCTHHHVQLLWVISYGPRHAEIPMVEALHHCPTIGKIRSEVLLNHQFNQAHDQTKVQWILVITRSHTLLHTKL